LQIGNAWLAELLMGFAVGAVLMAGILALELAAGWYRAVDRPVSATALLVWLLLSFGGFVLVALNEELVARGYILQNLALATGLPLAAILSSLLFALAHLANPGASPVAVVGLFFAGALLAAGYLATSRLWMPIGLHLSWNFFQGPVFGFPVSGFAAPSLLAVEPVGPEALTGGRFGPEASLVGILAELIGIFLIWLWSRKYRRSSASEQAVLETAQP
jgi:membrane protease YdiL (CAAX protease family)